MNTAEHLPQFKADFSSDASPLTSREPLTIIAHKLDDPDDYVSSSRSRSRSRRSLLTPPARLQIFVFFPDEEKVGVKKIKARCCRLRTQYASRSPARRRSMRSG